MQSWLTELAPRCRPDQIIVRAGGPQVLRSRDREALPGREGDRVRARIIAVSLNEKEPRESKIGLTMRQTGLGRLEWLEADTAEKEDEKAEAK